MMSDSKKKQSFYIETYGCQMNEYDSMIASRILSENDSLQVDKPEDANLILLNTCAIRENAHSKVYNRLRSIQHLQKKGAHVGILGCMAQNLKQDLLYENLPIDFIIGPDELRILKEYSGQNKIEKLKENLQDGKNSHLKLSRTELYDDLVPTIEHHFSSGRNQTSAFVTIQRGCDNFCTFCVVPYTRGRERSRSPQSIRDEVNNLVANGVKSVVLLGQNVNSYQHEKYSFADLIKVLLNETDMQRIFFTSPHPKDFPSELIQLMANNPRFCNQVHLPLQAGSNEVLKNMKRNYTRESFLAIVKEFRETVADVSISTDIIVGFPFESEAQFEETVEVMQLADFDSAFMFAYSQRKGTIAAKLFEDSVTVEEKKRRLEKIIELQQKRSYNKNQNYIGKKVDILLDAISKRDENRLRGRMTNGRKVVCSSPPQGDINDQIGKVIQVTIEKATSTTLIGTEKLM